MLYLFCWHILCVLLSCIGRNSVTNDLLSPNVYKVHDFTYESQLELVNVNKND
jgi:hypothetical protein